MGRGQSQEALSDFLLALYSQRDPDAFPGWLVRSLSELIPAEQVTWNEMAPSLPWSRLVAYPALDDPPAAEQIFARVMLSHPCIRHVFATGDTRAVKISDFLSPRRYHATAIYRHLHRDLGFEDQLGVALTPPAGENQALALARTRRSFREEDRQLLNLLRPHLLQAHRNLQALHRARRAMAQRDALVAQQGLCLVTLDRQRRPLECPALAARWLAQYFADAPGRTGRGLPPSLSGWIDTRHARLAAGHPESATTLVKRRGGRRLTVRLLVEEGGYSLLLEERTCLEGAAHLAAAGLGRREMEVLAEAESGKANAEIAATLCISVRTVEKHLHNIYRQLGVPNRTAAVARLRDGHDAHG